MANKLPKAVVMDLGDTIINNEAFHFNLGLKYLHDEVLSDNVSYEEINDTAIFFKEYLFDKRSDNQLEVKFLDYLHYFKTIFGFKIDISFIEVEKKFMEICAKDTLITSVVPFLEYMKKLEIPIIVLSNSIFSSKTLKDHIDSFGILEYFREVISSADYIFRKPHSGIFRVVDYYLKKILPSYEKKDIYFIGNDYEKDVLGSFNYGFKPVWFNRTGEVNYKNIDVIIIKEYRELIGE